MTMIQINDHQHEEPIPFSWKYVAYGFFIAIGVYLSAQIVLWPGY